METGKIIAALSRAKLLLAKAIENKGNYEGKTDLTKALREVEQAYDLLFDRFRKG